MAKRVFKHFGVPTRTPREKERYAEKAKLYLTDPDAHPFQIEFLRFEPDSPMPEPIQKNPHAAFEVDNLEAAMEGWEVILAPFESRPGRRIAFIAVEGALIELMESSKENSKE